MTDEEHKDLSDRLFATSGFTFVHGMQSRTGSRMLYEYDDAPENSDGWFGDWDTRNPATRRPNLRDDATIGCLRALLGKVAKGNVSINWSPCKRFWEVRVDHFDARIDSHTETCATVAEALVGAFERYDTKKEVAK